MRPLVKRSLVSLTALLIAAVAYVHWWLPGQVESSMNVVLPHSSYDIDERAQQLHASLFVADLHADSLLWKRDLRRRSPVGHIDVPRLREGNVGLQVFSATTKSPKNMNYDRNSADSDNITLLAVLSFWPPASWTSLYARAEYQLDKLQRLSEQTDLVLVRSARDLQQVVDDRARGEDSIAALFLIEGAHPLEGELDNLDRLYERGLRIAGLTHFFDNELGGSLHGISGDGLSAFGRDVVRRANELGIIIDVAHSSPAMVADVLALSSAPVIVSHTGLKSACNTPRNIDDELMQQIAERGGLIGIGFWDAAICDVSPRGIVRSLKAAIDTLGVEHVALGSDYDGTVTVPFDISEIGVLTAEMLRHGFSEREIRLVMGENVKRFLLENLPSR